MSKREPARERYDALVDLFPEKGPSELAYALVKRTFRIEEGGRLEPIAPEALFWDVRDPELEPRWKPGSDFWWVKTKTDVAVRGAAYPAGGRPAPRRQVALSVGERVKRVEVFGRRVLEWPRDGAPRIPDAEPFERIEVCIENAYGGADPRVPVREGDLTVLDHQRLLVDHPGLYPRNPFGKGYVVIDDPADGIELPNLEDPDHPLLAERVVVRDPREWWRQPLPWTLDWTNGLMFPRMLYLGTDAWFPAPDDAELEEVRRGMLDPAWRALERVIDPSAGAPPADFFQEGALGQVFEPLAPGTPISVRGMHRERDRLELVVPSPPRMEIEIEGKRHELAPRLASVLVEPDEERVSFTWSGVLAKLPRVFVPHLHAGIPLALRVDGDAPLEYVSPPTVRARLEEARARGAMAATPAAAREIQRAARSAREGARLRERQIAPASVEPEAISFENERTAEDSPEPVLVDDAPMFEQAMLERAPYEPPAGALRAPALAPVWQSDGEHTGRLVSPEPRAPVPPTMELALPPGAQEESIPVTREVRLPEASDDEGPSTLVLPDLDAEPAARGGGTLVLDASELDGPATGPQRAVREQTLVLTEAQLRGDEPVPMRPRPGAKPATPSTPESAAKRARRDAVSLYDEPTRVLSGTPSQVVSETDELSTIVAPTAPEHESDPFADEGTEVIDVSGLVDPDED